MASNDDMRTLQWLCSIFLVPALALYCGHLYLENDRLVERANAEQTSITSQPKKRSQKQWPIRAQTSQPQRGIQTAHALEEALESANNTLDQVTIIRSVGQRGNTWALGPLAPYLKSHSMSVYYEVSCAIGMIGGPSAAGILEEAVYAARTGQMYSVLAGVSRLNLDTAHRIFGDALESAKLYRHRWGIVRALGQVGTEHAVGMLTQLMYEGSRYERRNAARALAESPLGLRPLMEAAHSANVGSVRLAAIAGLGLRPEPDAYATLSSALREPALPVKRAAVTALADRTDQESLQMLARVLRSPIPSLRTSAMNALGKRGGPLAARLLVDAFQMSTNQEKSGLIHAMANMNEPLVLNTLKGLLGHSNPQVRRTVATALSWRHPDILAAMDPITAPKEMRSEILSALVNVKGEDAVPTLVALASGPDTALALQALQSMNGMSDPEAKAALLTALNAENNQRVAAALKGLGGLNNIPPEQRAAFLQRVAQGQVGSAALWSLGTEQGADLRQALLGAVNNGTREVALAATSTLARMGGPESVHMLVGIVDNKDTRVDLRNDAIRALGTTNSQAAAQKLMALAEKGNATAVSTLGTLGDPDSVNALLKIVQSPNEDQGEQAQSAAIFALQQSRTPGAVTALSQVVDNGGKNASNALRALSRFDDRESMSKVLDVAWSGDKKLRIQALEILPQTISSAEVLPVITQALTDPDVSIAQSAMSALTYRTDPKSMQMLVDVLGMDVDASLHYKAARRIQSRGGKLARDNKARIEAILAPANSIDSVVSLKSGSLTELLESDAAFGSQRRRTVTTHIVFDE